jgi:MFS family permease
VTGVGNPLVGRLADRVGRLLPTRIGLLAAIALCIALPLAEDRWVEAALVVPAGFAFGVFWLCGMAMVADAAEAAGIDSALSPMLMNIGWAIATLLGAGLGGTIAGAVGDLVPYVAAAVLCAAMLVAVRPREVVGMAPAGEAPLSLASATQSRVRKRASSSLDHESLPPSL